MLLLCHRLVTSRNCNSRAQNAGRFHKRRTLTLLTSFTCSHTRTSHTSPLRLYSGAITGLLDLIDRLIPLHHDIASFLTTSANFRKFLAGLTRSNLRNARNSCGASHAAYRRTGNRSLGSIDLFLTDSRYFFFLLGCHLTARNGFCSGLCADSCRICSGYSCLCVYSVLSRTSTNSLFRIGIQRHLTLTGSNQIHALSRCRSNGLISHRILNGLQLGFRQLTAISLLGRRNCGFFHTIDRILSLLFHSSLLVTGQFTAIGCRGRTNCFRSCQIRRCNRRFRLVHGRIRSLQSRCSLVSIQLTIGCHSLGAFQSSRTSQSTVRCCVLTLCNRTRSNLLSLLFLFRRQITTKLTTHTIFHSILNSGLRQSAFRELLQHRSCQLIHLLLRHRTICNSLHTGFRCTFIHAILVRH